MDEVKVYQKMQITKMRTEQAQQQRIEQFEFNKQLQKQKLENDMALKREKANKENDIMLSKAAASMAGGQ